MTYCIGALFYDPFLVFCFVKHASAKSATILHGGVAVPLTPD